jgi:hypothetical protein
MRCNAKEYTKKKNWFDEECIEKKEETKDALRKFKKKHYD